MSEPNDPTYVRSAGNDQGRVATFESEMIKRKLCVWIVP